MTVDQSQPPVNHTACASSSKAVASRNHSPPDPSSQVMWSSAVLSVDGMPSYNSHVSWNALSSCRIDWFNNKSNRDNRMTRNGPTMATQGLPTPVQGHSDADSCLEEPSTDCHYKEDNLSLGKSVHESFPAKLLLIA